MYSPDNRERIVRGSGTDGIHPPPAQEPDPHDVWCFGQISDGKGGPLDASSIDPNYVTKGLLWPFVSSLGVYKCPSDTKSFFSPIHHGFVPTIRSMSMNFRMNPITANDGPIPGNGGNLFRKQSNILAPARTLVFIDENPGSINDGYFVCNEPDQPSKWTDYPAVYHGGGGGLTFADGHSDIHRWKDPLLFSNPTQWGLPWQDGGVDYRWLSAIMDPRVN